MSHNYQEIPEKGREVLAGRAELMVTLVEHAKTDSSGKDLRIRDLDYTRAYNVRIGEDYHTSLFPDEIIQKLEEHDGRVFVSLNGEDE